MLTVDPGQVSSSQRLNDRKTEEEPNNDFLSIKRYLWARGRPGKENYLSTQFLSLNETTKWVPFIFRFTG